MENKFEVELSNGKKAEATFITRLKSSNNTNEYIYYFITDEKDNNNVSIYSSKIVSENNQSVMKDLENEEERQEAYKIFSETYKSLREQDK